MPAPLTSILTADGDYVIAADGSYVVYAGEVVMPLVGLVKSKAVLYVPLIRASAYTFLCDARVTLSSSTFFTSTHSSRFEFFQSGSDSSMSAVSGKAKVAPEAVSSVSMSF